MATLKINDINKNFGKTEVLKGINLDIKHGEFLVLLGPSGCGKSTLLNTIAGLETSNSGDILIDDHNVNNMEPSDRDIALVFQSYALYPAMTVRKNVTFGLEQRKTPKEKIEKALNDVSNLLQITQLLDRKPSQLSGGQRQRVAMGRALVRDPKIFLFDEPLSNLDAKLRVEMRREIKKLHQKLGTTIVYVTHDQTEALTMSNRIAVFNDGKVQQLSSPDELYEKPVNSFVAEFIGENNKFLGQVADISGDKCKVKLEDGTEILANPVAVKAKGDKTKVSLRPERAIIDPSDKMDNNHKGKIEEIIYHGDHTRLRVDLLGNKDFILKVPNSTARLDLKKGNVLDIGWNSIDCRALDPK